MRRTVHTVDPMHAALHALPLAFASLCVALNLRAQTEPLPPIFAPKPAVQKNPEPRPPTSRAAESSSLRRAMNEQILAAAKAFEATVTAVKPDSGEATLTSDGALLMPRFVVRSRTPTQNEIEPPPLVLGRFAPVERVDRRRNALSATLMELWGGTLELNVVNGAGFGVDHNVDFTRVELAFRRRF